MSSGLSAFITWYGRGGDLRKELVQFLAFFIILTPTVSIIFVNFLTAKAQLTQLTYERRQAIADLSASMVKERLDRAVDLGVSLATRVQFRQYIQAGRWDDAVKIMEQVPITFPVFDRVFVADPKGILKADTPALPDVRGKSFSDRDWYKGVSTTWKPYVSEVYKRAAAPQYNVVAVAIPIADEKQRVDGILVLQIPLQTFLQWNTNVDVGERGFAYIVDQHGHVAAHPDYPPQGNIVDLSSDPLVAKALAGAKGLNLTEEQSGKVAELSAFSPVPTYGWAVVVAQPAAFAFIEQNQTLKNILVGEGFLLLVTLLLAAGILYACTQVVNEHLKNDTLLTRKKTSLPRR